MTISSKVCWQNCGVAEPDDEMSAIDRMEDELAPLNDQTAQIRKLITGFELCYHEAVQEAERIVRAIGTGCCPEQAFSRPPQRKTELRNVRDTLSYWCEVPVRQALHLDIGGTSADELLRCLGRATPLKLWQVRRIVDKMTEALDPEQSYHPMALNVGDYGEPSSQPLDDYYEDSRDFLEQTRQTMIQDTVDGQEAEISLAMAIDLFMPCHWNFAGSLEILLKAIGGDLHPDRPYTCCARNVKLNPLCSRLKTIADTLGVFWKNKAEEQDIDHDLLAALGESTPVKRWLAASLDKTIRLQMQGDTAFWLSFT